MDSLALYHYGIKGMKWGVRRTPEQLGHRKSRARVLQKKYSTADQKRRRERAAASKYRRTLSDEELRRRIERIKLEKQLKDLTAEDLHPGRKAVKEILAQTGKKVASTAATGITLYTIKVALSGKGNRQELGNAAFNGGAKKK